MERRALAPQRDRDEPTRVLVIQHFRFERADTKSNVEQCGPSHGNRWLGPYLRAVVGHHWYLQGFPDSSVPAGRPSSRSARCSSLTPREDDAKAALIAS